MARGRTYLALAVLFSLFAPLLGATSSVHGQEQAEDAPEATIAALQTEVAGLQTAVATLEPQQMQSPPTVVPFSGEPVASSSGLDVLYYYFVDNAFGGEDPQILGEVRNSTDIAMSVSIMGVSIALLDEAGNLVDEIPCEMASMVIPPHDTVPFIGNWINSQNHPHMGEWSTEQVTINFSGASGAEESSLVVTDLTETSLSTSNFEVSGWVENVGEAPSADYIDLIAAGYDAGGRFVGFNWGQITTSIPPGKKAKFTIDSWISPAFDGLALSSNPDQYTYRIFVRPI
jgi:hypothetical protein